MVSFPHFHLLFTEKGKNTFKGLLSRYVTVFITPWHSSAKKSSSKLQMTLWDKPFAQVLLRQLRRHTQPSDTYLEASTKWGTLRRGIKRGHESYTHEIQLVCEGSRRYFHIEERKIAACRIHIIKFDFFFIFRAACLPSPHHTGKKDVNTLQT